MSKLEAIIAIACGLFISTTTANWDWLPSLGFAGIMLLAYAVLFRKRRA